MATVREVAASHDREIDPEHFGVLIPYGNAPIDDQVMAFVAARRPGVDPDADHRPRPRPPVAMIEQFVEIGATKFVVVPFAPMGDIEAELGALAEVVRPLETCGLVGMNCQ